jgi:hypothetical protein
MKRALLLFLIFLAACSSAPVITECVSDADCVPVSCCHADSCVPVEQGPGCTDSFCSQECRPGTIDCGGGCFCQQGKCAATIVNGYKENIA